MPHVADRVKDTGTVSGTGNVTLANTSSTGFWTFGDAFGVGDLVWYAIESAAGEWEVGYGTLTSSTTLVRDEVSESSNANAKVNFGGGASTAVTVFNTISADLAQTGANGRQVANRMNLTFQ
jgi:hypothetical protein